MKLPVAIPSRSAPLLLLLCLGAAGVHPQTPQFKSGIDPALLQKAKGGNPEAEFQVGLSYDTGKNVVRDFREAASWYLKAADQGDARAQHNLGVLYEFGEGVARDYARAAALYRKSADQGVPSSQFSLGLCYAHGNGVPQDYEQAFAWYQKAADQGYTGAMVNMALMYIQGQGVAKDEAKAWQLIHHAAELGDANSQLQIAMDYEDGKHGLPRNHQLAKEWLRKSADQGNVPAEFDLAMMLSTSPRELYYWLGLVVPYLKGPDLDKTVEVRKKAADKLLPEERDQIDSSVQKRLQEQAERQ
jgi:TPR repeat protein